MQCFGRRVCQLTCNLFDIRNIYMLHFVIQPTHVPQVPEPKINLKYTYVKEILSDYTRAIHQSTTINSSDLSVTSPTSQLILQAFRRSTYVTAHSPTLSSLYLRQNSFTNSSVASPTSQFILQLFFRFSYITGFSLTSPGEVPMKERKICIYSGICASAARLAECQP